MSKKILPNLLIAIIFLGLGIFIGIKIPKKALTPMGSSQDTFQAGWNAAKVRLSQSPLGVGIPVNTEIKDVNGSIQKIEGNKLTVKIIPRDPLADPSLDIRTITVDSNTKISLSVQKDTQQFQNEMQAFQEQIKNQQQANDQQINDQTATIPPMPFEQKDISINDLKENQQISVMASQNIKDQKEFAAVQIIAQEFNAQNLPAAK